MSDLSHNHAAHPTMHQGEVSNDSINTEPWIERWWAVVVIGYVFLLCLVLYTMANQTYGH